jgi:hypothetical protein
MGEGSLSGWSEGILLSIAFVVVLGIVVVNFNGMYGKDHQIGLGTNTTADEFIEYQDTASEQIQGGEADFNSLSGITLKSSWGTTKEVFKIVASFITGGWIEQIFEYANAGEAGQVFAKYLRILWFLSLVFAILYILFKVTA